MCPVEGWSSREGNGTPQQKLPNCDFSWLLRTQLLGSQPLVTAQMMEGPTHVQFRGVGSRPRRAYGGLLKRDGLNVPIYFNDSKLGYRPFPSTSTCPATEFCLGPLDPRNPCLFPPLECKLFTLFERLEARLFWLRWIKSFPYMSSAPSM